MPAIHIKCQECNKKVSTLSSFNIGPKIITRLSCGHSAIEKKLVPQFHRVDEIVSSDGKRLYQYQKDFVKFCEEANIRVLLGDKFGLGKTLQSLAVMYLHPEAQPFLVICKSTLQAQWTREIRRWTGLLPMPINDSTGALEGFNAYVISQDRIRRFKGCPKCKNPITLNKNKSITCSSCNNTFSRDDAADLISDLAVKLGIKTVIIDECQGIKNTTSKRTQGVRQLVDECKYFIAISGSPIENNALEYFPVLNMIRPDIFPTEAGFIRNHLNSYSNGYGIKTGGLADPNEFRDITKTFIIRRSPDEVLDQFPTVNRTYSYCDLGAAVQRAYDEAFENFEEAMLEEGWGFKKTNNVLAMMSKMRHLTGIAKIDPCIDYVMEFLGSSSKKIVLFTHHIDVAQVLSAKLESVMKELDLVPPLSLSASLNNDARDKMAQEFIRGPVRVLIASTLASGEGLDGLQKSCHDMVLLERQWNPKKEENAEARLARIGQDQNKINSTYFVALGTIDEYFAELVEKKRELTNSVLEIREVEDYEETSMIRELAEILSSKGKSKWKLS